MAGVTAPIFPNTVKNYQVQILPADTTTKKTLVTGATNGTKVECINVTSSDTADRDVSLYLTVSAVDYLLCTVKITALSGTTNALPSVDILRSAQIPSLPVDANGNRILYVASGSVLKIASGATVTAAKSIDTVCLAGDF